MDAEQRIAHNETAFREVNERIEAGLWPTGRGVPTAFRCECGSLRCNQLIELTLADYEHVRGDPTHFVLVPGHEMPAVERIVERATGYVVVEKVGDAANVAEQADSRDG